MKALTVWQPWASLIMEGVKPYEFRRWPALKCVRGERIVIHAGSRAVRKNELNDLRLRFTSGGYAETGLTAEASRILDRMALGAYPMRLASGLGTAVLGEPRRASEIFGDLVSDSDRLDEHIWAWPLTDIELFPCAIPALGAQGFWNWPKDLERLF